MKEDSNPKTIITFLLEDDWDYRLVWTGAHYELQRSGGAKNKEPWTIVNKEDRFHCLSMLMDRMNHPIEVVLNQES